MIRSRSRAEWIGALTAAGVPCGDVRKVQDVLTDPQVRARRMIEGVQHATAGPLTVLGVPIKLSDTPGTVRTAPPTLGQHTDDVLRELRVPEDEIIDLRRQQVI